MHDVISDVSYLAWVVMLWYRSYKVNYINSLSCITSLAIYSKIYVPTYKEWRVKWHVRDCARRLSRLKARRKRRTRWRRQPTLSTSRRMRSSCAISRPCHRSLLKRTRPSYFHFRLTSCWIRPARRAAALEAVAVPGLAPALRSRSVNRRTGWRRRRR